jgi:hypothetical protein
MRHSELTNDYISLFAMDGSDDNNLPPIYEMSPRDVSSYLEREKLLEGSVSKGQPVTDHSMK